MLSSKDFTQNKGAADPFSYTGSDIQCLDNRDDFDDANSQNSVKTNNDVVLLWDLLKAKFRKSEEDELARIIGRELIQKCADLRDEYASFAEIYQDTQETESAAQRELQENLKKSSSLFSAGGNAKFLNQELSFFIENLQKKAVDSGLDENALIPKKNEKDKQIFEFVKKTMISGGESGRPQSAMTGLSSPSKMSNSLVKHSDPAGLDATMRSSFYSTRNGGFTESKGGIVESLKLKNVLELSPVEMQKISQIRNFMQEQADGLSQEIEELQQLLMASTEKPKSVAEAPSQRELKEYTSKLEDELLRSDQTIKVQKAMNVPRTGGPQFGVKDPLSNLSTPGQSGSKVLGLNAKAPLKLPPKGTPIRIIPKASIETNGTPSQDALGTSGSKIIRMTLKRGSSQSKLAKLPLQRAPSKTKLSVTKPDSQGRLAEASAGAATPTMKPMKLKIRQRSASRTGTRDKQPKVAAKPAKKELYGLDVDFLEGLGLGDLIEDMGKSDQEARDTPDSKRESDSASKMDNMTMEELREQFNVDGQNTAVGKLRGICKQYNQYYEQK